MYTHNLIPNTLVKLTETLYIIGSIHISKESANIIKLMIEKIKPDCVMVELDNERYNSMSEVKNQSVKPKDDQNEVIENDLSSEGGLFDSLQQFQNNLGEIMAITPGKDIITGINTALELKIPILLIDQPITETFHQIHKYQETIQEEEETLMSEINSSNADLSQNQLSNIMDDFQDPEIIEDLINSFHEHFPGLAKIFLLDREEYMLKKIDEYKLENPLNRVIIIVGAAHLHNLGRNLIKKYK